MINMETDLPTDTLACILESGIILVHPFSRNKSDFTGLIFSCCFLQASQLNKNTEY